MTTTLEMFHTFLCWFFIGAVFGFCVICLVIGLPMLILRLRNRALLKRYEMKK